MIRSSLTPELFSPAQIDFLRCLGVRVEAYTNRDGTMNQSVFNDAANFADGRVRMFIDGLRKLLLHDESKGGAPLPPEGTCAMCNGIGFYVSLPGDVITPCPGCSEKDSTRLTAEAVDSGPSDSAPVDRDRERS